MQILTSHCEEVTTFIGADTATSLCLLTILRDIREDVKSLLAETIATRDAQLAEFIDMLEHVAENLPNSLEEFAAMLWEDDGQTVPFRPPEGVFFDGRVGSIADAAEVWRRCRRLKSSRHFRAIFNIVQRYEACPDSDSENNVTEIDMSTFNAVTIRKIKEYLDNSVMEEDENEARAGADIFSPEDDQQEDDEPSSGARENK
jgi:hypothetical protein